MGVCLNVWCTGSSALSSKVKVIGHSSQLQVKCSFLAMRARFDVLFIEFCVLKWSVQSRMWAF